MTARLMIYLLVSLLVCGCAPQVTPPHRWVTKPIVILEVPGEGAYFQATKDCPAILVVRNIRDADVVSHEGGHAVWDAANIEQQYP